ncbi:unnamed protein product [Amaranthus hypochondriacus]
MISLLRFSSIVSGILFFSCVCRGNAITHLASKDHLKNLKHFLWKYGGGMDKLDSFRITESELAKWEKKCEALMAIPSSSETHCGSSYRQSNEMRIARYIIQISHRLAKLVLCFLMLLHIHRAPHILSWKVGA